MVLKKQVRENITKAIYSSSNICASTYDNKTKSLTIIFNNGGQYKYSDVSETDYMRFEIADSQGKVFNSHIKKYTHETLDKIDPKEILNEVTEIKNQEDALISKHNENKLIDSIKLVLSVYDTTNNLKVDDLKTAIATYESSLKKD